MYNMARKTKKEFSAGFVVFYKKNLIDDKCELLLLDHGSHISHPKGHIEKNETFFDCAKRELIEETGLIMPKTPRKMVYLRINNTYYYPVIMNKNIFAAVLSVASLSIDECF